MAPAGGLRQRLRILSGCAWLHCAKPACLCPLCRHLSVSAALERAGGQVDAVQVCGVPGERRVGIPCCCQPHRRLSPANVALVAGHIPRVHAACVATGSAEQHAPDGKAGAAVCALCGAATPASGVGEAAGQHTTVWPLAALHTRSGIPAVLSGVVCSQCTREKMGAAHGTAMLQHVTITFRGN